MSKTTSPYLPRRKLNPSSDMALPPYLPPIIGRAPNRSAPGSTSAQEPPRPSTRRDLRRFSDPTPLKTLDVLSQLSVVAINAKSNLSLSLATGTKPIFETIVTDDVLLSPLPAKRGGHAAGDGSKSPMSVRTAFLHSATRNVNVDVSRGPDAQDGIAAVGKSFFSVPPPPCVTPTANLETQADGEPLGFVPEEEEEGSLTQGDHLMSAKLKRGRPRAYHGPF